MSADKYSIPYEKFSPQQKLMTARLAARTKYPYFASALLGLVPREAPGLGTLGVTERMVLLWDPATVDAWPLVKLTGVLVHEVGHVLRAHMARAKTAGVAGPDGRPLDRQLARVWNAAADLEINDDLVENHPECFVVGDPTSGLLPKAFGLADGMTAEAYYRELRQQQAAQESGAGGEGDGAGDVMSGECGSCSGNPLPGEPNDPTQGGGGAEKARAPKLDPSEGRSETEVERVRREVAGAIREANEKGRGSVPAGWARWAEDALQPPKVRWQDKLARACRGAAAWKAGAVDATHRRTSRRQWGIGFGPGRPLIPAFHAPRPEVGVAVDTSGSMGEEELGIGLREVRGVMTGVGARVAFVACDCAVHESKVVDDWRQLAGLLKGGGGTSFVPAFEALAALPRRPDVVIFVTDGDGEAPAVEPTWCKTIWLLVGSHRREPCGWGEKIHLDD